MLIYIQNLIFLSNHHYSRKNKTNALKILFNRVNSHNVYNLSPEFIDYISQLQEQIELKRLATDLITKIKSIQQQFAKSSENVMRISNISNQKITQGPIKIQSLVFQLKESFSLERICILLNHALSSEEQKQFYSKLETSINTITNKFLNDEYDEAIDIGTNFTELLRCYWKRRGKKWDQSICERVENKIRELRGHKSESRSRTINRG